MISRYELYCSEQIKLDKASKQLPQTDRYQLPCQELRKLPGVGLLSAMTFLTEMGDVNPFHNRFGIVGRRGMKPQESTGASSLCPGRGRRPDS